MKIVEEKMTKEIATYIKEREAEAKLEVDEKSKELLVGAMQNIQQILQMNKQYQL